MFHEVLELSLVVELKVQVLFTGPRLEPPCHVVNIPLCCSFADIYFPIPSPIANSLPATVLVSVIVGDDLVPILDFDLAQVVKEFLISLPSSVCEVLSHSQILCIIGSRILWRVVLDGFTR